MIRRRTFVTVVAAGAVAPLQAQTTAFPNRVIRVVPFGTAGGPMIVARGDAPYADFKGLVEFAKKQGKPLSCATWGSGNSARLFGELHRRQSGAELTHVPYKAEAQVHCDMFANALDFAWANPATARGHVQAGNFIVDCKSRPA